MKRKHNDDDQLTFGTMDDGANGGSMDEFMQDIDQLLQKQEQKRGREPEVKRERTGAREVTVKRRIDREPTLNRVYGKEQSASEEPRRDQEPINTEEKLAEPEATESEKMAETVYIEPEQSKPVLQEQETVYVEPEPSEQIKPEQTDAGFTEQEGATLTESEDDERPVIESDIEQEEHMRQKRISLFAKPDILLETPYVVTVGNKQYTRYRLEFGRPDSNIPPELATSAGSYVPKIEEVDEREVKKRKRKIRNKNIIREVTSWVSCIVVAIIIALLINNFVFSFVRVQGDSMLDTLNKDNWLFVWRAGYIVGEPQRGDVVICHFNGTVGDLDENTFFIKRVVGLPGETVSIEDGYVYVDGRKLEETYLTELRRDNDDMQPIVLGQNEYFVLGDNRINSTDSRAVGPVRSDQIIGKAVQKLFPFNQFGPV